MNNILVVCIGNICRSPMGEALLQRAFPDRLVCSAGVGALVGKPADPLSIRLMADVGLDITEHRAQQISTNLVQESQLILVMDLEQKKFLERRYPSARGKVFLLSGRSGVEIPDPYREGMDEFRIAYQLIEQGVRFWVGQIRNLEQIPQSDA